MVAVLGEAKGVVERGDRRDGVKTVTPRRLGQLLALRRTDRADVSDQGHLPLCLIGDDLQHLLTLFPALHEGFPGRATDIQPIDTLGDVKPHQTAQTLGVQPLLMVERC